MFEHRIKKSTFMGLKMPSRFSLFFQRTKREKLLVDMICLNWIKFSAEWKIHPCQPFWQSVGYFSCPSQNQNLRYQLMKIEDAYRIHSWYKTEKQKKAFTLLVNRAINFCQNFSPDMIELSPGKTANRFSASFYFIATREWNHLKIVSAGIFFG